MDNIRAIIEQCRQIKREHGYSNQYIAEQTGVPEGTVARVFGNKPYNFKYETIQPIVSFLIGFDEPATKPMPQPSSNMIAMYHNIVESKDATIAELKEEHKAAIAELKAEHKAALAELRAAQREDTAEKDKTIRRQKRIIRVFTATNFLLVLIDLSLSEIGWFQGFLAFLSFLWK